MRIIMTAAMTAAVATAGLLLTATRSQAADLPARVATRPAPVAVAAAPAWGGFYVGLFAGYGWGNAAATAPFDSNTGFFYNFFGAPYTAEVAGFFGGGTVGYNIQSGAIVYGVEGEAGYLGLKGSAVEPNDLPNTNDTVTRFKSALYDAIYGRLGFASGNALFYGKGGVAFLDAEASTIDPCVAPPATCGTTTLTMTGSKVGGQPAAAWSGCSVPVGAPRPNMPISISARSPPPARAARRASSTAKPSRSPPTRSSSG